MSKKGVLAHCEGFGYGVIQEEDLENGEFSVKTEHGSLRLGA